MRILITGGAGFIGSHLADKLLQLNHEVFVLDDLSSGDLNNLSSRCKFFEAEICDKNSISEIFEKIKPDVVYHLAAQINVRKSITDPVLDAEINTIGTLNILNECVKHKVEKIIFSSSGGAIYRDDNDFLKTENSVIQPASPYGISKWTGEQYIKFYKEIYGLDYTILRLSNVYGPRQNSKGEAGVISIFINNIKDNKSLTVFGTGEQIRDYIYVEDVANAMELSLRVSGIFNVSTGKETTVNQLVNKICLEFNYDAVTYAPKIEGELFRNCLSSKLLQSCGWQAMHDIDSGLNKTIKYFKNN
jgi:UDP-glucose 4-epimerase